MPYAEVFGYIAAGLVLATFSMRTMIPLRLLGIASNIAFITYAYIDGLWPVLLLHALLLPLNVYRMVEMLRLIRDLETAEGDSGIEALMPYMTAETRPAGSLLFRSGDDATEMYVVAEGRIRLEELGVDLVPGDIIGEIGVFSANAKRTATAVCAENCRLQRISRDRVRELVFQNPRFGFYLLGLIADRLVHNMKALEERAATAGRPP